MKTYNKIYDSREYKNIRNIIDNSAKLYPNKNAFILKETDGKKRADGKNRKYRNKRLNQGETIWQGRKKQKQ